MATPDEFFAPKTFFQLGPDLVRMHGLAGAAVLSRIHWRTDENQRQAIEVDGVYWWRARLETLADEIGLSYAQVQRAVKKLVDDGALIRTRHYLNSTPEHKDVTYSYRIALESDPDYSESDNQENPDYSESDNQPDYLIPDNRETDNVPIETLKTPLTPQGEPGEIDFVEAQRNSAMFDQFWEIYPKKDGPVAARKAFRSALSTGASPAHIIAAAQHYADDIRRRGTDYGMIRRASKWLYDGDYDNPLTPAQGTVRRAQTPDEIEERIRRITNA
jgi:hypothetical protein